MPVAIVQTKRYADLGMGTSPITPAFDAALTPGNTIALGINRANPVASMTWAVTDTADSGSVPLIVSRQHTSLDIQVLIFARRNIPGGNTGLSIALAAPSGSGDVWLDLFELSGVDNAATILSDSIEDNATSNSKFCASAGGLSGTGFVYGICGLNSNRIYTAGAGYTRSMPQGNTDSQFSQYQIGTVTSDRAAFTHDGAGSARAAGAMMILPELAVGGIGFFQRRTLVGGMQIPRGGIA